MIRLLARLFRPRRRVLDLPALCPRKFTLDEVRAALSGHREDPKVQAILQILAMTRTIYLEQAQKAAQAGGTTHYDHGGMAAIEDTLAELFNILNATPASDDLKAYFPNT
jgi:hypothetical protein